MPNFDAYSAAALTPGGVASGLSDLTSAFMQKQIADRRSADMAQQRAFENDLATKRYGLDSQNVAADNQLGRDQLEESKRHHDQMLQAALAKNGQGAIDAHDRVRLEDTARQIAAMELFGPAGKQQQQIVEDEWATDFMGRPITDPNTGQRVSLGKKTRVLDQPLDAPTLLKYNETVEKYRKHFGLVGTSDLLPQQDASQIGNPINAQPVSPASPAVPQVNAVAGQSDLAPRAAAAAAPAQQPIRQAAQEQVAGTQIARKPFTGKSTSEAVAYLKQNGDPAKNYAAMSAAQLEAEINALK